MKRVIAPETTQPTISFVPDVAFARVPHCFGGALRELKMDMGWGKRTEGVLKNHLPKGLRKG